VQVASEVALSLTRGVDSVRMVAAGRGEVGAARLTADVIDIVQRVPGLVEQMTGVKIQARQR